MNRLIKNKSFFSIGLCRSALKLGKNRTALCGYVAGILVLINGVVETLSARPMYIGPEYMSGSEYLEIINPCYLGYGEFEKESAVAK